MKAASQPYAHKGAALVIILVLLLVVSLIAVGSYESAMLESRMVASSARIHETLENAEQGLLAGELAVRRITSDEAALDLDNEDAVYPLEGRGAIDPLDTDWSRIPFKASGQDNWALLDSAITLVEDARQRGLEVTTDMYMYNASSTGLNVLLPAWAKDGGHEQTMAFLEDPAQRERMIREVRFHVPPENILALRDEFFRQTRA